MKKPHPGHKEAQPENCPDAEWKKMYLQQPSRDWTCADLTHFINSDSKESKARARKQLAFRIKYNLK
jgi:hypothetical protein